MGRSKMRTTLLLFLFLFIFVYVRAGDDEVSALLSIKLELVDPLDALGDWKTPAPHCNWTGIRCNAAGSVESVNLSHMNLSGVISTRGLQRLASLAYLNLCCNAFSSSLPKFFGNLTMLKAFDISENFFMGEFPVGLGASPALTLLNASGNNFVGRLPEDITNVTTLEILDLRGCFFQGSIPSSFKSLRKLKFLGLSGNNLTGVLPAELGQLSSLEKLIIGYNEFEGNIPPVLGDLTSLKYLDMAVGNLNGSIPNSLGRLPMLTTLFLFKNNLEGDIPKEIGNISSLALLDLSDNQISGEIPAEIAQLSNLQLLNLMCNNLKGIVPSAIGDLTQLEVLELWNNSLTGPLPMNLGHNSSLRWVDVSSNSFSGLIPDSLCNGGNLTKLILFNNGFSGEIPASLTQCMSLVRVRIQNNRLNGTIPVGFGKLPNLQRLELAGNVLIGEIPDDIALSTSLSFIDLSHNQLQLPLPSNMLSIPTLQTFMASDNELTGGIPDQFQDCPSLSALDLSNNKLSGNIPASLASCERLVSLNLRSNAFSGDIPSVIAMMTTLAILDLSNNLLTGTIPEKFGSSPALETLNLSYNKLTGPVPENGMLRTINPDDLAGNVGLCGGVLPPCNAGSAYPAGGSKKAYHIKHIVAGWVIGVSVVIATGIMFLVGRRFYRYWYVDGSCCEDRFDEENSAWPWRLTAFQRVSFTSSDVLACIKEVNVLGMGATGIVYKADMPRHHAVVAVKKLWRSGDVGGGVNDVGDIAREVNLLGRLRHRNIVRLLGYLHNDSETMFIYEYMPNGSLWEALHGKQAGQLLVDWVSRYNIANGIAQGMAYLHHDCHPPVIHRDVKSNNILLDTNLDARIADFGLAKMLLRKNETVSVIAGSYGYIAPEYGYTLKVDQKSDIYSFGVVLMELVTGKRPVEPEFGEGQDIVGWVREKLSKREVEDVLDRSVGGQCKHVQEEMMLVLRIAVLCAAKLPKDRPSMRDVLTMLGEAKPRRKSSSASVVSNVAGKDKPVFSTSPESEFI